MKNPALNGRGRSAVRGDLDNHGDNASETARSTHPEDPPAENRRRRASDRHAEPFAARLAAIQAEINAVISARYAHGRAGPHRRARDLEILQGLAADIHARLRSVTGEARQ